MVPAETKENRTLVRVIKILADRLKQIEIRLDQLEQSDDN